MQTKMVSYRHPEVRVLPKHMTDIKPIVPVAIVYTVIDESAAKSLASITPLGGQPHPISTISQSGPTIAAVEAMFSRS